MESSTQGFSINILTYQDFAQTYCYPNPTKEGLIKFAKLPNYTKIRIFNLAGELVYENENFNGNETEKIWSCENNAGQKVASGVYIYILKDERGNIKKGKLAVIR